MDSVKFTNDTIESEKLYTSIYWNDGKFFDVFTDCSYDSVPVLKPNRDTTVGYTYTFKGWKRDESEIAKNKLTYTATYDSIVRKYAVAFLGENSEVYSLASLAYGTMPVDPRDNGINPTKASTKLNDFVFYKWNPDLSEVETDIAYRAEFESRMHPYTCMFYNCDTLFKIVDNCAYDYAPAVDTPKRDCTADYAYRFMGWSKDTSMVSLDTIVYTAVYDSMKILYTRLYYNCDTLYEQVNNCTYDSVVTVENPKCANTVIYDYKFDSWSLDTSKISRDTLVYIAVYKPEKIMYTRLYYNCDTLYEQVNSCAYDSVVNVEEPIRKRSEVYKYDFNNWSFDTSKISRDTLVYTAVYNSEKILYTRLYYNCDTLYKQVNSCAYDSVVTVVPPTRVSTEEYNYVYRWGIDESKIGKDTLTYTAVCDSFFTKKNGVIRAASYKISATESVYFSQGNLQFTTQGSHKTVDSTAKGTWRFAENQWDVIGYDNGDISETNDGWIDLFGWGTSGWDSGAEAYQPWSTETSNDKYMPGGNKFRSLTGNCAKADWGVYNAISNGGDEPNMWRTLSNDEWKYLFKNNTWTLGYIQNGGKWHECFMLIPETFTAPEGITVTVLSLGTTQIYKEFCVVPNFYSIEQFASIEKLGIVALPCGGYRNWCSVDISSLSDSVFCNESHYWSSTADYYLTRAYELYVNTSGVYTGYTFNRYYGSSVRLVQNVSK